MYIHSHYSYRLISMNIWLFSSLYYQTNPFGSSSFPWKEFRRCSPQCYGCLPYHASMIKYLFYKTSLNEEDEEQGNSSNNVTQKIQFLREKEKLRGCLVTKILSIWQRSRWFLFLGGKLSIQSVLNKTHRYMDYALWENVFIVPK